MGLLRAVEPCCAKRAVSLSLSPNGRPEASGRAGVEGWRARWTVVPGRTHIPNDNAGVVQPVDGDAGVWGGDSAVTSAVVARGARPSDGRLPSAVAVRASRAQPAVLHSIHAHVWVECAHRAGNACSRGGSCGAVPPCGAQRRLHRALHAVVSHWTCLAGALRRLVLVFASNAQCGSGAACNTEAARRAQQLRRNGTPGAELPRWTHVSGRPGARLGTEEALQTQWAETSGSHTGVVPEAPRRALQGVFGACRAVVPHGAGVTGHRLQAPRTSTRTVVKRVHGARVPS